MQKLILLVLVVITVLCASGQTDSLNSWRWTTVNTTGDVVGRHENAFVEFNGKFYLMGGRGINPVNVFDPETNTWETKGKSPMEIHHFQPVVYKDAIYLVGAMTGGYPTENPLEHIWIYYPEKDLWKQGDSIPKRIRRGGAGVVLHNHKLYIACGIEYGHTSGTNNYFDSYDLRTGEWQTLTKAPHVRDHFAAIVVNNKLYCIGGRNTSVHAPENFGAFFAATIPYVDVFDFEQNKWFTLNNELPIPTAAAGVVNINDNIIYMGGEGSQKQAYNQTQCLNVKTGEWTQLSPLNIGRHGSGAILYNNDIYIAAGSENKGGGNMNSVEVFSKQHNWEVLFNGVNLSGWEVKCTESDKSNNFWKVDKGTICCNSMGSVNHNYIWLQSVNQFDDFELRLKFQVSDENKGNSGVQIRSRYDGKSKIDEDSEEAGWLDGPQVDIDPLNPWRNGFIYDETRTNKRWINPDLPDWKISKEVYAPERVNYYGENEESGWNDMTIICDAMTIKTIVNNIIVSEYDATGVLDSKNHEKLKVGKMGHIALQLHKNSENNIRFKDIEIRSLE